MGISGIGLRVNLIKILNAMVLKQVFLSLFYILFISMPLFSQNGELVKLGELKYLNFSKGLPENLASTRSAVIVSVSPDSDTYETRSKWIGLTEAIHKSFRKIGIDAIIYIHQDDLNAGPEVTNAYREIFDQRNVKNLIYITKIKKANTSTYSILVTPFQADGFMKNGQEAWQESSDELDHVVLMLGRQILRQDLERSNFLIPEHPEYLNDLSVFTGTRFENYPSRLQSLPMAVVAFEKASTENLSDPEVIQQIEAYNLQIDEYNNELAEIMKSYPYKYEIVQEKNEEVLYDRGFQYALMPMSSSAKSIKRILDYKTTPAETVIISTVVLQDSLKALKRMPADANVTKYYIKQTIVKDLHTGNVWDADVSWQKALKNFIFHLKAAF